MMLFPEPFKLIGRRKKILLVGFPLWIALMIFAFFSVAQGIDVKDVMRLPSAVNSEAEESMPLLAPDGKTLLFTRLMHPENMGGKYDGSDIWSSRWDMSSGSWSKSDNRRFGVNTKGNNTLAGINKKGDVIYLLNTWGIAFARKTGDSWSRSEQIHIPDFRAEGFIGAYVCPDYDVVLISMKGEDTQGQEDLYVSLKNSRGEWSSPKNLGSTINTKGFEISPFLSADKKRLYFSSDGHPGLGDADIFYSDRLYESWETWSAPKNLGDKINSSAFDAYFSIYGDSVAFYSSSRGVGMADIYKARVAVNHQAGEVVKRFLTEAETREVVGMASMEIKFDKNSTTLGTAQNELLFYIVNKVITRPEIKLQLIINEEKQPEASQKKLEVVSEKLKISGISSYRIETLTASAEKDKVKTDGVIKIILFK